VANGFRRAKQRCHHASCRCWSKLRIHCHGKETIAEIAKESRRDVRHRNVHNRRIGDGSGAGLGLSLEKSSCCCDSKWRVPIRGGALPSVHPGRSGQRLDRVHTCSGVNCGDYCLREWIAVCGRGRPGLLGAVDPAKARNLVAMGRIRRRVAAASYSAERPVRE